MKRFSKVSFDDIKTIQVDSGVLLKDFDVENPIVLPENVICATSGGINPVCAPEYYDFGEDVDNAKSAKETKRIRGWNATISFTTLTTSLAAIKLALGAADISGKVLNLRQRLQYAKDFSDIWWVGKRADDKLLAIRLIRSLSDSGFSLQTNKRGKGQISVTLKGHCSFSDIKKVPMEIYVLAEVPTVSLYIYGTPSDSGNIGLRSGESVTLYDGAVLPEPPERDATYKYAAMVRYGSGSIPVRYHFHYFNGYRYAFSTTVWAVWFEPEDDHLEFKLVDGTWVKVTDTERTNNISVQTTKWANFDVLDINGEDIVLHNSDPIPVSGIVGYSYNGTVLPELPEWDKAVYPYAVIDNTLMNMCRLHLFEHLPFATTTDNGYVNYGPMDGSTYIYKGAIKAGTVDRGWTFNAAYTDDDGILGDSVQWANFDLLYDDGSVCCAKSDPIPVYE